MDYNTSIKTWAGLRSERGTLQYMSPKTGRGAGYFFVIKDSHNATATSTPLRVQEEGDCPSGLNKGVLAAAISGAIVGALFVAALLYLAWSRHIKRKAQQQLAASHARATADLRAALAAQARGPDPGHEEVGVVRVREEGEDVAPAYDDEGKPPLYEAGSEAGSGGEQHAPRPTQTTTYPPRPQ